MTDDEMKDYMPGDALYLSTWSIAQPPMVRLVKLEKNTGRSLSKEYPYEVTGGSLHKARDLHLTELGARNEIAGRIRGCINSLESLLSEWDHATERQRRKELWT